MKIVGQLFVFGSRRLLWFSLLAAYPLWGQVEVREQMAVHLRQMTVHVLDSEGTPVPGLSASDFKCLHGNVAIEPQGFRPVRINPVVQPVTVFLDTSLMDRQSFAAFQQQLLTALTSIVEQGYAIKLVHFDEQLQTLSEAAQDDQELSDALSAVELNASFRARLSLIQNDINEAYAAFRRSLDSGEARDMIKFNAENVFQKIADKEQAKLSHFSQVINQVVNLCDELSGLEGHQCLYFLTGGVYLEKNGRYEDTFTTIRSLADHINRAGVTVHSLIHNREPAIGLERLKVKNRGFFNNYQAMKELAEYSYQKVRSQVELMDSGGNTLAEGTEQYVTGPVNLSRWTGGRCEISSPNFIQEGLTAFLNTHQFGYELDFVLDANNLNDSLTLELKEDKGFSLLYPRTFRPPKPFRQWTKEEVEVSFQRIMFFGRPTQQGLTCQWGYRVVQPVEGRHVLPVFGGLKGAPTWKSGIEVGFSALDAERQVLDVIHERVSGKKTSGDPMVYHVILCENMPKYLRFFARELSSGKYALEEVELDGQEAPQGGVTIGGLNLGSSDDYNLLPLPHLKSKERDPKRKDRAKNDPYLVGKRVVIPNLSPIFPKDAHVPVFFQLAGVGEDLSQYGFDFYMTQNDQSQLVPGKLSKISARSKGKYSVEGFVTMEGLEIGEYVFTVVIFPPGETAIQKSCYAWIVDED